MNAGQLEFGSKEVAEKEPDVEEDMHDDTFNHHMDLCLQLGFANNFSTANEIPVPKPISLHVA